MFSLDSPDPLRAGTTGREPTLMNFRGRGRTDGDSEEMMEFYKNRKITYQTCYFLSQYRKLSKTNTTENQLASATADITLSEAGQELLPLSCSYLSSFLIILSLRQTHTICPFCVHMVLIPLRKHVLRIQRQEVTSHGSWVSERESHAAALLAALLSIIQ